jgi:hypothetical protein
MAKESTKKSSGVVAEGKVSSPAAVRTETKLVAPVPPGERGCTTIVNCCDEHPPKHLIVQEKKHCCCFEVFMTRCRVVKQTLFDGKAELMLTGYANEQQATFPGMGLWFVHHKKWGWRNIHKRVGRYCFEKGQKLPVYLLLDAIEVDVSAAGAWEIGSNENQPSTTISLECGVGTTTATLSVNTHRVKNALAATTTCTIEVEFAAFEVSCCCCD